MKEKILSVLLVLLTGSAAIAQEKTADATGCDMGWLWTISGKCLVQRSYLFGTCHGDGHQFTEKELFSINGLENALDKVDKVLFEGGLDTDTTANAESIKAEIEKMVEWLKNPGPEWMMPEGTYYKPLYDSAAHFTEVNKFVI